MEPARRPETYARWYLRFAVGKILDHRGNSADRSVKLAELAWLLGRRDVISVMDAAGRRTRAVRLIQSWCQPRRPSP